MMLAGAAPPKAVTVLVLAARPRSTWSGAQELSASFSANQHVYLAGLPRVDLSACCGTPPPIVVNDQPDRAADGRVGPEARTEQVPARVEPDLAGDRAVDDQHRAGRIRGALDAVQVERLAEDGLDRREAPHGVKQTAAIVDQGPLARPHPVIQTSDTLTPETEHLVGGVQKLGLTAKSNAVSQPSISLPKRGMPSMTEELSVNMSTCNTRM